ncbi:MAG TPA: phage protease [Candidatus Limnocylindria bacterium]|jgi:hypothetical protein|nr:phage protease [Candidatus Limnocylindria bacterium]
MPELETRNLKGVEILDIGTWQTSTGEFTVTEADLSGYVSAFDATKDTLKIPAKLGHDQGQRLLQQDGYPAAGWLERLYVEGTKLCGDFAKVPAKVADLIEAGGYRKVSAEIWHDVTVGAQNFAALLMGVAFLGEDAPAVTTLDDIIELYGAKVALTVGPKSRIQTIVLERKKTSISPKRTSLRARFEDALGRMRQVLAQADVSHEAVRDSLQEAIDNRYGGMDGYAWIVNTFDDHVVVQKGDSYYSVPYTRAEDGTIGLGEPTEVVQTWIPASASDEPAPVMTEAKRKEQQVKTIALALGLPETATEADIVAAIAARPTAEQFSTTQKEVTELKRKDVERDAASAVDTAIRAKKIAPANRESMIAFALADSKSFAAFAEKAPAIVTGTAGSDGDAPPAKSAADEINDKIVEFKRANPTASYADALASVSRAHPELARKHVEEQRGAAVRLS